MSASHLIAWLVCLVLAFFASAISLLNRGETIRIEKSMEEMRSACDTAAQQAAVLDEVRALLRSVNERMQAAPWRTAGMRALPPEEKRQAAGEAAAGAEEGREPPSGPE